MLTGMFRHSQPQEIVNFIDETPTAVDDSAVRHFDASNNLNTYTSNGDFLDQDNGFKNAEYQNNDSYFSDDYSDDDSFI